ncbi:MAG: secretin and TonB N-terminal domain-containing protein, partial [Archangium sp.]|nr:secretin and TonB N-terminal domain-containing protein [Archangium sp.]
PALAAGSPPKRVSFEFVNADVTSVLRVFAEVGKLNLVTADSVSGKVTMSLRNVPWDEAFQAVLASKGLGVERTRSILRVAPLKELADEEVQRAAIAKAQFEAKPLKTTLIPVNYASAADMAAHVKATLSSRGTVSVDTRTNTLIIRDVE